MRHIAATNGVDVIVPHIVLALRQRRQKVPSHPTETDHIGQALYRMRDTLFKSGSGLERHTVDLMVNKLNVQCGDSTAFVSRGVANLCN